MIKVGVVLKSTGSLYLIKAEDGSLIKSKIKGRFRIKGIRSTNPVAVGDVVEYQFIEEDGFGVITGIKDRRNYLVRKATKLSKSSHIIAANVDQAFLIITTARPKTLAGFIDRFLVTTEAYHIPVNIVFNKIDMYLDDEKAYKQAQEWTSIYEDAGYPCFHVSALTGQNIDQLQEKMKGKVNLLSGHSGVGKSHIINKIQPGLDLRTGEISDFHKMGKHTTTFAEMHELDFGGYIIDTPGIKGFGLYDFVKEEVSQRFPEMRALMNDCQFNNCMHTHEPKCAVKEAVENGDIAWSRYQNYLAILEDDYFDIEEWENK
ncbi:MAG: ribosome small subunit-dependent GTPase A [Bacteroidales bacterium]|nr:ribosome small subunit-dependent GTPase A [Bacteroidales bacterium]